jgi:cobalamin biosynthesis Mg chelatase CobN
VRTKIAAAVGLLALAAPEVAAAGSVTPIQYAYGGGSNASAVIASQPPASPNGGSTGTGGSTGAGGAGAAGTGGAAGSGGSGASGGSAGSNGHRPGETTAQPVVGLSGSTASPTSSSFDALHHAIPTGALLAIAFAAACALGAWLVRRRSA